MINNGDANLIIDSMFTKYGLYTNKDVSKKVRELSDVLFAGWSMVFDDNRISIDDADSTSNANIYIASRDSNLSCSITFYNDGIKLSFDDLNMFYSDLRGLQARPQVEFKFYDFDGLDQFFFECIAKYLDENE